LIKKFYGPPGTGKTEKLIRRALAYVRSGTDIKNIGYFAFTKKAANTAKERMLNKNRQFQKKDLKYFQTLHSLAFRTLGLKEENVMQDYHYDDIGKTLSISVKAKRDLDSSPYLTCDNEYFQIILKSREKNIKVWDEYCTAEYDKDINPGILKHIAANYFKYKENNALIDYTDMIHQFIEKKYLCPKFDVVFIDEAQDLSPIQWMMYDILKANTKDMYLAGDDDQAIYAWAGADVDRFIKEPAKEVVLKKSRRVPVKIQEVSNIIISRIEGLRADKVYHPKNEEGSSIKINNLENVDLSKDNWLILTRTINKSIEIAKQVKQKGYLFENKYIKNFNTKLHKAAVYYSRWTDGEDLEQTQKEDVEDYMSEDNWNELVPWYEAFDKANLEDKNYIRLLLSNKEKLTEDPRIKISTIHAAKGGECDNVILVLDNARKIREGVLKSSKKRDEEHRVWYVGITRSKNNLYLMRAKIERHGYNL
jgi:DNA helicase-2/ATP-dependent DNA helicase PcrA